MQLRLMYSVDISGQGKTTTVLFVGSLENKELATVKKKLLSALDRAHFLRIDLQNIESIEFSFLALLLSFLKTIQEEKKSYEVVRLSKKFVDTLLMLGIPLSLFKVDIADTGRGSNGI